MNQLRRGHILGKPIALLFLFLLITMGLRPWLHTTWSVLLLAVTFASLEASTLWLVCRSDFGPWHRILEFVQFVTVFSAFLAAGAASLIGSNADSTLVALALLASISWCLLPTLGVAWIRLIHLRREGFYGPWAKAHVDLDLGQIHSQVDTQSDGKSQRSTQWIIWVPVAVTNIPLVWRALEFDEATLAGMAWLLLGITLAWVAGRFVGPTLAEAIFLLRMQATSGVKLRYEDWQEAQVIRRGHWLSR